MEEMLKKLIKEAVLEALMEYANGGVALASEDVVKPESGDGKEEGEGEKKPIRPKPNLGNSGFSFR